MASPAGSAPEIPPVPPASASPPSTESPPPAASSPTAPQPDVPTAPPTSSSPPPVPGSPPPAIPPPTVAPIPSSPPPISPPPDATPPLIASPPPPSQEPPPASPPEASPPPPSAASPSNSPPPPSVPTPSPPTMVPSPPPVASPPSPATAPPPSPAETVAPTPPASLPPASPLPPSTAPPPSSPPPASSPPPPVTSLPPTPSKPAPPTPAEHSPSPPPDSGLPPPPDSQTPGVPAPSPPSRSGIPSPSPPSGNGTQPTLPPGKSPSLPPSSSRSPPSNTTPSGSPSSSPVSERSLPGAPIVRAPSAGSSTRTSNSTPDNSLPGDISSSEGGGIKTGTAVGIAVIVSLIVLGFMGVVLWFVNKRKKQAGGFAGGHVMPSPFNSSRMSESCDPRSPTPLVKNNLSNHGFQYSPSDPELGHSRPWFTYEELSEITDGFSSQNLLGEGGFGCVYKGRLPDGREVAVKQLKVDGGQGEREFRAEVEIISRVHHRHLVSLVGYCISESQKLLIYDYVPNNTLHYHLHEEGRPVMEWATRLKVASGAARGLAYLHEDCHPRIIHRDIKSSNILLDNNFEARVSDFGLAKLAVDANTHVTTRVVGTFGYLAPEYASSGKLTSKSDVFSFGVVLLELVTGRKPVDPSQPVGDESLVEWARPLMTRALETGEFEDLPDPRLERNYNPNGIFRMIEVAAACVRHSAAMRPHMGQVVRALDGLGVSTDLHNGMAPGQSELFHSAQQSEEIRLFQRMAFGDQDYASDFSHTSWSQRLLYL
ncbi:hypothetical protein Taro_023429 [Colocasia esculenta]|uniref:non-specific serine/threonine protein kinase n=1 Tax=Colocasia esculenta TaxID=4460 RepID=A0A843VEG2_COLES|nr:hypothetical protein [Colocasia esculenta]